MATNKSDDIVVNSSNQQEVADSTLNSNPLAKDSDSLKAEKKEIENIVQELARRVQNSEESGQQMSQSVQALQSIFERMSSATGELKEFLQACYDRLQRIVIEERNKTDQEERDQQTPTPQDNKNNNDASADVAEIDLKKMAVDLFNEVQEGAMILAKITKGFFDKDGNELDEENRHKSTIWQTGSENISQAMSAMGTIFEKLKQAGFKVETKEHQEEDQSATVYGVSLPDGFALDDIFTMKEEEFEKMLRAQKNQQNSSPENMEFKVVGSMEVQKLSGILAKTAQEFVKGIENSTEDLVNGVKNIVDQAIEGTHYRDLISSNSDSRSPSR